MSIRMNEWGMHRLADAAVRIPVQGLTGWNEVGEQLGSGVASAVLNSHHLMQARQQVISRGEMASFSERLHHIGRETEAELAELDVEDWDYSWQQLSAPRIAQALDELSPHARSAAEELAADYNAKASLLARKNRELSDIQISRRQWQQRVDHAVQAGDAERAAQWLDSGAGVFVPQSELEQRKTEAASHACSVRWQQAVQSHTLSSLADFFRASRQDLPEEEQTAHELTEWMHERVRLARRALAQRLAEGAPVAEDDLQMAVKASVLSETELAQLQSPPQQWNIQQASEWMRMIDEAPVGDAPETELLMALGCASVPETERKKLRERMRLAGTVPEADRRTLSRRLLQLYGSGGFGCVGDDMAQQRLHTLQMEGLPMLAEQGAEAVAQWLDSVSLTGDSWVCFSDLA